MTITVRVPNYSGEELFYTLKVVLSYFLNVNYCIEVADIENIEFCEQKGKKRIIFKDFFFKKLSTYGYSKSILPTILNEKILFSEIPLNYTGKFLELPILFGKAEVLVSTDIKVNFDMFGTIFFLLSRIEEVINPQLDKHQRYIGRESYLFKMGCIHRPVVDEYIHFLVYLLKQQFHLLRNSNDLNHNLEITCDVDHPFYRTGGSFSRYGKAFIADLVLRKQPMLAINRFVNLLLNPFGVHKFDPYYTFNWYLSKLKEYNLPGSFYFICDHTDEKLDGFYSISEKQIGLLVKEIIKQGHSIGVHGSYNSILSSHQVEREREIFKKRLGSLGIKINSFGSRQHYLRWNNESTPDILSEAGYTYDSSGGYADICGYKYGTARQFPMWSLTEKKELKLIQKPIIIMEATLLSTEYMNLGYGSKTEQFIKDLYETTVYYGGVFRILWHNSHLLTKYDKKLLEYIMQLDRCYEN